MVYQLSGAGKCSMLARMNPSKVIGLVALAEKPGLGEACLLYTSIKHGGIFIGTGRKLDGPGGLFLCFVRSK